MAQPPEAVKHHQRLCLFPSFSLAFILLAMVSLHSVHELIMIMLQEKQVWWKPQKWSLQNTLCAPKRQISFVEKPEFCI